VAFAEVALQVIKLTSDIEESYEGRCKASRVLVDLTAAYYTVWHQGLALKLLQTSCDRHLVRFIVDISSNRSFILNTSDGQCSCLRRLKNGVPQGSMLAPMLFNIYISDIPGTVSIQYSYAHPWPSCFPTSVGMRWKKSFLWICKELLSSLPVCMEAQADHSQNYMHCVPPE